MIQFGRTGLARHPRATHWWPAGGYSFIPYVDTVVEGDVWGFLQNMES